MENKKIIQVSLFKAGTPKNEVLTTNGDAILDNIVIRWETSEDLFSGDYTLDLTSIIDNEGLHKLLKEEAILKVHMDYGSEIFKIAKVNRGTRDIKVFARQITIEETLNMWLVDVRPTNTNGQGALSILKNNSIGTKDIEFFSDIDTISTAYYMDMSVYEALHNCDQSFMNRWGGEILRRGYTVTINKRIGADHGVQIRSGKNLTGFAAKTDIDRVVTRIVAKGFDGIRAKNFIDSPLINSYSSIKTKEIKYDFVKVKNENNPDEGFNTLEEAQAELEILARLEFSQNHIDELRAEYDLNYIQLERTEEYKNFVQAERAYLGDTINVFEEKHNVNIHVRCFQKKFDGKRQKVMSMKLTNTDIKQKSITTSDILAEINSIIKKTDNNNVQDIIQSMINSGIKDSYVIPRQNEIIIADNKNLDKAMNVMRLNKNGLGFSQDGYYGTYRYGFTSDGVINASLIATGILSAISIQNADGSLQIDLSGRDGIEFLKNGVRAIEIAGQVMKFFDWDGTGDPIAEIFSSRLSGDENKPGLMIGNTKEGFVSIGYRDENNPKTYPKYMLFDIHNLTGEAPYPIMMNKPVCFDLEIVLDRDGLNEMYTSIGKDFINKVTNYWGVLNKSNDCWRVRNGHGTFELFHAFTGNRYCLISEDETFFGKDGHKYASFQPDFFTLRDSNNLAYLFKSIEGNLVSKLKFFADNGMVVNNDLQVYGNKNCIQKTEKYGDRNFYSVEDCESYLTDRSMHLMTVEEVKHGDKVTYERVVILDNIFKDSVNLDLDYTVEIIKQSPGDFWIKEQTKDYFIVESDRSDFSFKYVVTAKRKGFEEERNKEVFLDYEIYSLNENNSSGDINANNDLNINDINNLPNPINNEYWRLYTKNKIK